MLLGDRVELSWRGTPGAAWPVCRGCWPARATGAASGCVVDDARKRLPEIFRHLDERGAAVTDVTVTEPTLESVFIELAR